MEGEGERAMGNEPLDPEKRNVNRWLIRHAHALTSSVAVVGTDRAAPKCSINAQACTWLSSRIVGRRMEFRDPW